MQLSPSPSPPSSPSMHQRALDANIDKYRMASIARNKLCAAASRPDHDMRVLVSHANLLDNLIFHLNSDREQERAKREADEELEDKVTVTCFEISEMEL